MKKGLLILFSCIILAAMLTPMIACSEKEEKVIELKFGGSHPLTDWHAIADLAWIDRIHEQTKNRVHIEYYPANSLVDFAESWAELMAGVADIAYSQASFTSGFEITKKANGIYYGCPDSATRQKIYQEVCDKHPDVMGEYDGGRLMGTLGGYVYQLISKKPVHKADDMKGMSIRAAAAYVDMYSLLGAQAISMPATETYVSAEKGIIDCASFPIEATASLKLGEVMDYVTLVDLACSPLPLTFMRNETYDSLPKDIQKIFDDNVEWYSNKLDQEYARVEDVGRAFCAEHGVEVITPSAEEKAKFWDAMKTVSLKLIKELDDMGYDGTGIFNETRALVDKYTK